MNDMTKNLLTLMGRLTFVALFLPAGLAKVSGFEGTVGYIASVGLPLPTLAALVALVLEIVGSMALLAGFATPLVSIVLAIFTLVATFAFHPFWAVPTDQAFVTQLLFYKNIAVVGGLLILASQGAGSFSIDARREQNSPLVLA